MLATYLYLSEDGQLRCSLFIKPNKKKSQNEVFCVLTHLNANTISSCLRYMSSSIDNTASVSISLYGINRLFRVFLLAFITCSKIRLVLCQYMLVGGSWTQLQALFRFRFSSFCSCLFVDIKKTT